ncbi:C40 family peptidase [Sneathia sanguinegens]|jgi:hypothetical protein|uniref:C40 family peptidase n=1 Tax=Sneathia sanguinegens TaxID=40543 RepID=A0ABT7HLT2_9FUSO|nr:C40 family peptidase [Sneathia sanguinegens]MDK9581237.1 C40 family peptidase [Sneathia sanguinegens]MDU4651845.1 C40 family peptidase [Sneathia sanguinegens]MDU7496782.1 C40 family peptidase [Sneathia sanguinegens]
MIKKIYILLAFLLSINFSFSKPSSNKENLANDIRMQIHEYALKYLDTPYRWGSNGPNNFDCSGFVNYVYKKKANITLPRVSSDISKMKASKVDNFKVGDILFFKTTKKERISHVGIYIGNNKFIHASSAQKKVIISKLEGYYKKALRGAINLFE